MSTKPKRKKQAAPEIMADALQAAAKGPAQPAPEYDPAMIDRLQLAALADALEARNNAAQPAAAPGPKSTDAAAQAQQRQATALQGLTAALDSESWRKLARLQPMLAEGIQQAIMAGAAPGAIGAMVAIRGRAEGLASMAQQAARHFAATYTGQVTQTPDPMAGVIAALDAMAYDDLIDRYPDLGSALQAAVAQGLPVYAIRAHVAGYTHNADLAHYIDQAASHLARIMTEY